MKIATAVGAQEPSCCARLCCTRATPVKTCCAIVANDEHDETQMRYR